MKLLPAGYFLFRKKGGRGWGKYLDGFVPRHSGCLGRQPLHRKQLHAMTFEA